MAKFRFISALLALTGFAFPAFAQVLERSGEPGTGLARKVDVQVTKPNTKACQDNATSSCFRVMFNLKPIGPSDVGISFRSGLRDFTAFSSGGAICTPVLVNGMDHSAWDRSRGTWDQRRLTYASADKPAMLVVDFNCDNALMPGDEVTIQASFHLFLSAVEYGDARYMFEKVAVK